MTCAAAEKVDQDKKVVIQEYMRPILSNVKVYRIKLALVLQSLLRSSDRTRTPNPVEELLGTDEITNIPTQQMNEVSKFILGGIVGKHLISIGDQTGSEVKNSSVSKQTTGEDAMKIGSENKQPFYYIFSDGIAVACSNLPSFQDDKDGHIFERLCMVPCTNTIEYERWDNAPPDKMLNGRSAIFNWFLEGSHRLIDRNFKITHSSACEETIKDYREELDTVFCCSLKLYIIAGDRMGMVVKAGFDRAYMSWCALNRFAHVNKQNIRDRTGANGCPADKANIEGKRGMVVYRNLKQKEEELQGAIQEEYT